MTHIRAIADVPTSDEPTGTDPRQSVRVRWKAAA